MLRVKILLILVSVACAAPAKKLFDLPPEIAKIMVDAAKQCSKNLNLDDVLKLGREGKWREDEEYQVLTRCGFKLAGYSTEDGTLNLEKSLALFDADDIKKVINDCYDENPEAFHVFLCFQKNSPVSLNLRPTK